MKWPKENKKSIKNWWSKKWSSHDQPKQSCPHPSANICDRSTASLMTSVLVGGIGLVFYNIQVVLLGCFE